MQKLIAFTAGAAAFLTGCQSSQTTETWKTVKAARHVAPGVRDRDRAYADELHKTLQKSRVEHKVVTFTFRYTARLRPDQIAEGTAVIYRDSGTPSHPWWLMREHLANPVWLPTEALQRQVSFYLIRPATILKVEEFPSRAATEAPRHRAPARHTARLAAPVSPKIAQPTGGDARPGQPKPPLVTTVEPGPQPLPPVAAGPGGSTPRDGTLPDPTPVKTPPAGTPVPPR
jgi:hypothetical protein